MHSRWTRFPWPIILTPLVIFWDAVLGFRLLAPGDGYQQYIPWYTLASKAWGSGHLPTWNPFAYGGSPHLATNQPASFYLPTFLFTVLPEVLANNLFITANFIVAGLGAWFLARRLTSSYAGAIVAGLSFGLSGFMFARVGHQSLQATAALLPWVILGYERLRERFSGGRLLVAALPIALSVLAGHSQILFGNVLALGLYAGVLAIWELRQTKLRPLLIALAAVIAGFALAAVQLFPTIAIIEATSRVRITFEEAMTYSFPPSHAVLLVFPYLFGTHFPTNLYPGSYLGEWNLTELTGYPGAAALILAGAGLTALRRDRRLVALTLSGVFAALLAFGPSTPLSHLFYRLPIYGQFRSWARYIVVFDLAIAILAAHGISRLTKGDRRLRRRAALIGAAVFVAIFGLGAAALTFDQIKRYIPAGGPSLASVALPWGAALLATAGAILLARKRMPLILWSLTALVAIDLYLGFGGFYEWRYGSPKIDDLKRDRSMTSLSWGRLVDAPSGVDRYLFIGGDVASIGREFVHATDLRKYLSVNGNNPLAPRDFLESVGMTPWGAVYTGRELWNNESDIFDLLRVTTILVDPHSAADTPDDQSLLTRGTPVSGGRLIRYEYSPRLPDAFLVGAAVRVTRSEALATLRGETQLLPADIALIDQSCPSCPRGRPGPAGQVRALRWGINSVVANVDADRAAMLVLSQSWFPGWHAWVDGKPAPVLRVEGLVQGIPVPAGQHRVDVRYRAPGLKLGFFVSLVSLATLIAWAILDKKARRYGFSA